MVNRITNNIPKTPSYEEYNPNKDCNLSEDCCETPSINESMGDAATRNRFSAKVARKTLRDITTLSFGDSIDDEDGVTRYVIAVDYNKCTVQLTGKNTDINNYKRTYTWTQKKVNDKVENEGWTLN